jgi:2',3'-cyclic-nucleotide 2'-phosphodiesterase (5'-nucleotidase family)
VAELSQAGQPIVSPSGAFLHVSEGTTVRVDCERPRGQRVVELKVNERTVPLPPRADPSIRYRVAMPDFLLEGGDGYGIIFKDAASDLSRNPVTATSAEGKATDANLTEAYMRAKHPTENQALKEAGRVIFDHCARPGRPVVQ